MCLDYNSQGSPASRSRAPVRTHKPVSLSSRERCFRSIPMLCSSPGIYRGFCLEVIHHKHRCEVQGAQQHLEVRLLCPDLLASLFPSPHPWETHLLPAAARSVDFILQPFSLRATLSKHSITDEATLLCSMFVVRDLLIWNT